MIRVIWSLALTLLCQAACADVHRLQCTFDDAPNAIGLRLVLDTEARTMSHIFPGNSQPPQAMPMRVVGDEWVGELVIDKDSPSFKAGTVVMSISVDRYTMRFRMYNMAAQAFGGKSTNVGQCARVERQL